MMLNTRYYYVIVTILLAFVPFSNSQSGENDSFVDYDNSSDYYDDSSGHYDGSSGYYDRYVQSSGSEKVQFDGKYKLESSDYDKSSKFMNN